MYTKTDRHLAFVDYSLIDNSDSCLIAKWRNVWLKFCCFNIKFGKKNDL